MWRGWGKKLKPEPKLPKDRDPGVWLGFFLESNECAQCGK